MSAALVVFAKAPEAGLVKTRLCPPFTPQQAAAFYACMLDDVLEATARVATLLGLAPWLAVHPPEACPTLSERAPQAFHVLAQRGADLGQRMEAAVVDAAGRGLAPILLRGSDSPALGEAVLGQALAALREDADLVLSPDRDGGYNLVGLRQPAPGLFAHPMSTRSVLEDTLAGASRLGLRWQVLETGFDIDTAADLLLLAEARRQDPAPNCPRSLAYLDRHRLWPEPNTPKLPSA